MTIAGTVANDKVYDGDTLATLSNIGAVTHGRGHRDPEPQRSTGRQHQFNTKDVQTANTVTASGYSLADGSGLASNYALTSTSATAAANITPKSRDHRRHRGGRQGL